MYLSVNFKNLRKARDMTQEQVAEALGVSPQSVSKWEREETLPDIALLPSIANLFETSVDQLLGMDRIYDTKAKEAIYIAAHAHLRRGESEAAVTVLTEALKVYPGDAGILSDLAMALALSHPADLDRAIALCDRALQKTESKISHTTRAALCIMLLKAGRSQEALALARQLPHARESREAVVALIEGSPPIDRIDAYLAYIMLGEAEQREILSIAIP